MVIKVCLLNLNSILFNKAPRIAQDRTKIKTQNYSKKKQTKPTTECTVTLIATT